MILGNPASGGPFARPLARSALFFGGARIAGPVLVLVGWAARVVDPVEIEEAAAAGAAV